MSALDPKAASERLRAMLDGTFHYTAYRGKAPDGVPTMRADIDVVLSAPPKGQAEAVAVKPLDDDHIMEIIKEVAPWKDEPKLNDLLTYEKSPPLFPQATYDVPSYRAERFVRAVEARIRSALASPAPAGRGVEKMPWPQECATEGCDHAAAVYFVRGNVGSHYCRDCYLKIQALPAAPTEGK